MGAFVQEDGNGDNQVTGTTIAVTLNGVAAGNLLWCAVACFNDSTDITVADDQGNTWSEPFDDTLNTGAILRNAGDGWQIRLFYAENVSAGNTVVTATYGTSVTFRSLYVQERSGHATTSVLDGNGSGLRQTTGTTRNAGSESNTGAGDLVSVGQDYSQNAIPTAGTGFTGRTSDWNYGGSPNTMLPEDQAFATTGSRSATFGMNNGSISYCLQMFLLNPGGGGGGRIMGSLAGQGGLAGHGGIAGRSGGLAG